MSKIARKPIPIPEGVEVKIENDQLVCAGKAGSITLRILPFIKIENVENQLQVTKISDNKQSKANWGTMASLTKNALAGVTTEFTKILEIEGIGFKAALQGTNLTLNLGFTHPILFTPPEGIKIVIEKNQIKISGVDKSIVGQVAAQIRKFKKPEPYKGKGIHYLGEVIRRKATKKVAGTGTEK